VAVLLDSRAITQSISSTLKCFIAPSYRKHLEELGAPLPEMPPFDESKFEPMPEVEIDPEDEFHVGALSEDE
jgi:hypothetical protein